MSGIKMVMALYFYSFVCNMTLSATSNVNIHNCPKPLHSPNQFHVQDAHTQLLVKLKNVVEYRILCKNCDHSDIGQSGKILLGLVERSRAAFYGDCNSSVCCMVE